MVPISSLSFIGKQEVMGASVLSVILEEERTDYPHHSLATRNSVSFTVQCGAPASEWKSKSAKCPSDAEWLLGMEERYPH